jgi:hypothetical protein
VAGLYLGRCQPLLEDVQAAVGNRPRMRIDSGCTAPTVRWEMALGLFLLATATRSRRQARGPAVTMILIGC